MKEQAYDPERIARFVNGQMAAAEREALRAEMAQDARLRTQVETLQAERNLLRALREESLRQQMDAWEQEMPVQADARPGDGRGRRFFFNGWLIGPLLAAACLLLLWSVRSLFFTEKPGEMAQQQPDSLPPVHQAPSASHPQAPSSTAPAPVPRRPASPDPEKLLALADMYFRPPEESGTLKSGPASRADADSLQQARHWFRAGEYARCLAALAQPDSSRMRATLQLRGSAYFKLGRYAEAEADFEQLARIGRSEREEAAWNALMSRIAAAPARPERWQGRLDSLLAAPQHPYHHKAQALSRQIAELRETKD